VLIWDAGQTQVLRFSLPVHRRGLFVPPRLALRAFYRLGIVRAWSYIALDMEAIVYPKPVADDFPPTDAGEDDRREQKGAAPRAPVPTNSTGWCVMCPAMRRRASNGVSMRAPTSCTPSTSPSRVTRACGSILLPGRAWTPKRGCHGCVTGPITLKRREQPYGLRVPGTARFRRRRAKITISV
jgi:hypothetical protein